MKVEMHGSDGYEGPIYIGRGCFHRRDTLCGRKFIKGSKSDMKWEISRKREESGIHELEKIQRVLQAVHLNRTLNGEKRWD